MDLLLKVSIILLIGVLGGRLAKNLHLPYVTGYLVGGLLIGPSFLGLISDIDIVNFGIINEFALAAIAFSIGSEFNLKSLAKIGNKIFIITLAEALTAVLLVFLTSYYILGASFELSLVLGAIASATAPAATVMIIRQYKAEGPLTRTLLPVVAIDDAVCIMAFGIALAIAKLSFGANDSSFIQMIAQPIIEIVGSLGVGFILGILLTFLANKSQNQEELLALALAFIVAGSGLASALHLSSLLVCMMLGATLANLMHNSKRVFNTISDFTPPIYLFFFTLAGASLHLNILPQVGVLGVGYIVARSLGKIIGAGLSAKATGCDNNVVKYLGLGLLPQAGVAIGLTTIVRQELPQIGAQLTAIVLGGVLFYEVIGPILAKYAIEKSGEMNGGKAN